MKTKFLLSVVLILANVPMFAATTTYSITGTSGTWEGAGWTKSGLAVSLFPNGAGDIAQNNLASPSTITLDITGGGTVTIGKIAKPSGSSATWTINAGSGGTAATFILDNTGGTGDAQIYTNSGSSGIVVNADIQIANTDLEVKGGGAPASIGGAITAATGQTRTLKLNNALGGAVNISNSVGASGGNILIDHSGIGAGLATISGNLGVKVTGVTQNSTTSAMTLSGTDNSAFGGGVTVTAGTLKMGNTTALSSSNLVTMGGGTFDLNNNSVIIAGLTGSSGNATNSGGSNKILTLGGSGTNTYGGTITPATASRVALIVALTGSGSQTLTGDSSFGGGTTITSGTLLVNNSTGSATGTGAVGVNAGTLGGGNAAGTTGFVGGLVNLASGAHIAPGMNAAGTLTLQSGLALNATGGSILDFELGTTSDLLKITGGTFAGNSSNFTTINIFALTGLAATTYTLIDWTGAAMSGVDAGDFTLGIKPSGFVGNFSTTANSLQLTVTTVPEPSTWALLAFSLTTVMVLRRRKRD